MARILTRFVFVGGWVGLCVRACVWGGEGGVDTQSVCEATSTYHWNACYEADVVEHQAGMENIKKLC